MLSVTATIVIYVTFYLPVHKKAKLISTQAISEIEKLDNASIIAQEKTLFECDKYLMRTSCLMLIPVGAYALSKTVP